MKTILTMIVLMGFLFSQGFVLEQKPPTEQKLFEFKPQRYENDVFDEDGIVILGEIEYEYKIAYWSYLYDEDGQRVKTRKTQGNLMPRMTSTEKLWLKNFTDKYADMAKNAFIE